MRLKFSGFLKGENMILKGCFTALVTPFTYDNKVDYEMLKKLIHFQLESGIDGIVVLGTTAEAPTLSETEKENIIRLAIKEINGKIPVVAGVYSNDTQKCIDISRKWENMGADALLVSSPYYNKANELGMEMHFAAIADSVSIPVILYNVPSRTGCSIPISVVEKLSRHSNITGIKEASGDMSYNMECARYISDSFSLISGNDNLIIPCLSVGGAGVISVFSNICPGECRDIVHLYLDGKSEEALSIQMKYLDFINSLFIEPNPVPIKTAMNIPRFRLPLCQMMPNNEKILRQKMKEVGLC